MEIALNVCIVTTFCHFEGVFHRLVELLLQWFEMLITDFKYIGVKRRKTELNTYDSIRQGDEGFH